MEYLIQKTDDLSFDELDRVILLIEDVWKKMESKEWFTMDEASLIRKRFQQKEATLYLAKDKFTGDTAGLFMVTFPALTDENLGWDLNFSQEDLLKTAHMDTVVILPKYRGYGLQKKLMLAAEMDLKERGIKYLLCTIHPDNRYSLGNALALDYQVVKTTQKYGGLMRHILQKEL